MESVFERIRSEYITDVVTMAPVAPGVYFVTFAPCRPLVQQLPELPLKLPAPTTKIVVRVAGSDVTAVRRNSVITESTISETDLEAFALNAVKRHLRIT